MSSDVLTQRQLNRALLARQMLLERVEMPAADAVERLVGMQAQLPGDPYVGLWSRLAGFDPLELSALVESRAAVRTTLMRGTIHLVTAADCLVLLPRMQPMLARAFSYTPYARDLAGLELNAVLAAGRALVEEHPLLNSELGRRLEGRWRGPEPRSFAMAVQFLVGLVQVTPRGLWGKSGKPALTTVEHWLGKPLGPAMAPEELVRRYLRAFGPASPADMQNWSRMTRLREVFEGMRGELRTYRDQRGRELFDVPDGVLVDPDTPAPVRFLPVYDNVVLGHDDRSRIVTSDAAAGYMGAAGRNVGTVLIDGHVAGPWWLEREKREVRLVINLGTVPAADVRVALEQEALALLTFLEPGAERGEVAIAAAG